MGASLGRGDDLSGGERVAAARKAVAAAAVGVLGLTLVGVGAVGAQGTTTTVPTTAPATTSPPPTLPPPEPTITVAPTTSTTTSTTAPEPESPPRGEVTDGAGRASAWLSHSSGPPGTVLTIEGDGCPQPGWGDWDWHVGVTAYPNRPVDAGVTVTEPTGGEPTTPLIFTAEFVYLRVEQGADPLPSGDWSTALEIPTEPRDPHGELLTGPLAPEVVGITYGITALCWAGEGVEAGMIRYRIGNFEVTPPGSPAVENPRPAEPINAVPTLTG